MKLKKKYKLFEPLLKYIKTRRYRMVLERLIPIFFTLEIGYKPPIYGDIHNYGWGLSFEKYLLKKPRKIEKVWTGR